MERTWESIISELKESTSTTFSTASFEELVTAYANDRGWEVNVAKLADGKLVTENIKPSEFLTKMVQDILVYGGVDSKEASDLAANYKFKKLKGVHNFISEVIFGYMESGKSFKFNTKEDFVANIGLVDREGGIKEYNVNEQFSGVPGGTKKKSKIEKHRTLKSTSTVPKWLKADI